MRYHIVLATTAIIITGLAMAAQPSAAQVRRSTPIHAVPANSMAADIPAKTPLRLHEPAEHARAYGIVTDSLGQPIADAQVELATKSPFFTVLLRTDDKGLFVTDSLLDGEVYSVTAGRLGYRAVVLDSFTARADSAQGFRIVLSRRQVTVIPGTPAKP